MPIAPLPRVRRIWYLPSLFMRLSVSERPRPRPAITGRNAVRVDLRDCKGASNCSSPLQSLVLVIDFPDGGLHQALHHGVEADAALGALRGAQHAGGIGADFH